MDIFGFLTGISPWWWVAAALALATLEVLTFTFFLIWPAMAAVIVAIAMWLFPDMTGAIQILIFALLSIVLTIAGRMYVIDRKPVSEVPGLNERSSQLIGRRAVVVGGFEGGGLGNVEIDGMRWRARMSEGAEAPKSGDVLTVTGASGMTLVLDYHR